MFNIHFSVLTNFTMFVHLEVFLWVNFISRNICYFFQLLHHISMIHCIKSVRIRKYSSPHFSLIRTEYGEKRSISPYSIRMRENARKMPTRITSNTDAFYAVIVFIFIGNLDISRLVSALPLVSLLTLQKFCFLLAKFVLKK